MSDATEAPTAALPRVCTACGTSWRAAVNECPECSGTGMEEVESVDELAVVLGARPDVIELIRRDERAKVSDLLHGSAPIVSAFASDAQSAIELVAYMLRFDPDTADLGGPPATRTMQ